MNPKSKSLEEQLTQLPRDIAPPRNLWHGIVFGIARRQRYAPPRAFAAAAACLILAGALTFGLWHERSGTGPARPQATARTTSLDEPSDPAYRTTRARLETTFRERLSMLSPGTRAQIEASLAVIREAHENIRKALAAEPGNPVLEQLFESTWHDEFDLYDRVVQTTEPNLTRT
jgi:hypothetical protein